MRKYPVIVNSRKQVTVIIMILSFFIATPVFADEKGLAYKPAPEWTALDWFNSPELSLSQMRGKVVIIEFFQMASKACNEFSIPLMYHWGKMYQDDAGILLLSIHSVYENHEKQNDRALKEFLQEKGIKRPVGVDAHYPGDPDPITLRDYGAKAAPTIVIIDKKGDIRFQQTGPFNFRNIEPLIRRLRDESETKKNED